MTFTTLKAKPGDLVLNDDGLAVGRINKDLTEDNRWTADGKCSISNGFLKATGITPSNPESFHKKVDKDPNDYVLKGYTICLKFKELPVEMWSMKAAEILGGQYSDFREMLEDLSKQPDVEREAKLCVIEKFFTKEHKSLIKKNKITPAGIKAVDDLIDEINTYEWFYSCPKEILHYVIDQHFDGVEIDIPLSFVNGPDDYTLSRIKNHLACMEYFDRVAPSRLLNPTHRSVELIAKNYWEEMLSKDIDAHRKAWVAFLYLRNSDKPQYHGHKAYAYVNYFRFGDEASGLAINEEDLVVIDSRLQRALEDKRPLREGIDVRHRFFGFTGARFYSSPTLCDESTIKWIEEFKARYNQYLADNAN